MIKVKTLASLDETVQVSRYIFERLEHLMQEGRAFELVHLVVDNEPCPGLWLLQVIHS